MFSQKLVARDFWRITNKVLDKSKFTLPPLFNALEVLASASDRPESFAGIFSKNCNLDNSGVSLPAFPSRTNLKLKYFHNSQMD